MRMERQATDWGKTLAVHISDERLASKIHKGLKLNNKKKQIRDVFIIKPMQLNCKIFQSKYFNCTSFCFDFPLITYPWCPAVLSDHQHLSRGRVIEYTFDLAFVGCICMLCNDFHVWLRYLQPFWCRNGSGSTPIGLWPNLPDILT